MKQVTLLGDSIRMGYQETVRKELEGTAEVWSPEGNCMHSMHHLFNLVWYVDRRADVIHFNFGLWDCRRLGKSGGENAVPVELFARNLDFILEKIQAATPAILIWATITPVVQERYNARFTNPSIPAGLQQTWTATMRLRPPFFSGMPFVWTTCTHWSWTQERNH